MKKLNDISRKSRTDAVKPKYMASSISTYGKFSVKMPFCPICEHPLYKFLASYNDFVWITSDRKPIYKFCPACGQQIDWSDYSTDNVPKTKI